MVRVDRTDLEVEAVDGLEMDDAKVSLSNECEVALGVWVAPDTFAGRFLDSLLVFGDSIFPQDVGIINSL
jgi:hypothetical protein